MTTVSGPMSGGSSASAPSVSYSLTAKNTMSTGPTAAGSSSAFDARQMQVAFRAGDAKAARAQRVEMRAAREECDVDAGRGQPAAEVSAHAAAADDRDPHETAIVALRVRLQLQIGSAASSLEQRPIRVSNL